MSDVESTGEPEVAPEEEEDAVTDLTSAVRKVRKQFNEKEVDFQKKKEEPGSWSWGEIFKTGKLLFSILLVNDITTPHLRFPRGCYAWITLSVSKVLFEPCTFAF
eukprot:GHVT01017105.1.p1 GENE.GHVT01017105.1~~GHVT01017105.1.p1  ORF type:complete len:116 (-),score=11.42 GHVT01017105.1:1150-1464(-)